MDGVLASAASVGASAASVGVGCSVQQEGPASAARGEVTAAAPVVGRSLERETAQVVTSLRRSLEAKARLYPEAELQQLFLMNNLAYLVKSM